MNTNFRNATAIAIGFGSLLLGNPAYADGWPTSVAGNWSIVANQSAGTLTITQPASTLNCRPITGSIFGNPIEGFYCPSSGRIAFSRKINNIAAQYYQGNFSQAGAITRIGGNYSSVNSSIGGPIGEYSFYGTK